MPPRFVMSKPLHTMTNDVQSEITLPKARSARCRREGGRGEVWCGRGAGEIWARYGRDAGEARLRASLQTRSKRDPGEIHRPRCPCGAAREGRAQGQPTHTARAARVRVAGPARPLAHGKDLRAKSKGAGSASHQASPTLPATEAPALLPPLDDVCDFRAAHVDPDPAVGVGPVRERRHEQPPLGAPAVRSERLRRGGRKWR